MFSVGILTISDKGSRGEREDCSGPEIRQIIASLPARVEAYEVVPDEEEVIADKLREYADGKRLNLILTTGGTGLSPRDVTPEATRRVLDKEVPGIPEAMRAEGVKINPFAMLSRAAAGIRGCSLIVNLPGSPRAVRENLAVILPVLKHALEKAQGDLSDCGNLLTPSARGNTGQPLKPSD
jgi:molybdopterin adenylyltransferase